MATDRSLDFGWHTTGHAAVCLAIGCGWREDAITPLRADARAVRHYNDTGHRVGIEKRSTKAVVEGITDAR